MSFEPGDVVVVPFPFTEKAKAKRRPALVLSRPSFNDETGHVTLAMITTAAGSRWATDVAVIDTEAAGLKGGCYVRLKLFTLPTELILKAAGSLASDDRTRVAANLGAAIAL